MNRLGYLFGHLIFQLEVPMDMAELVNLIAGTMNVPENVVLNQFDLINKAFNNGPSFSLIAEMTFQRKVMYHLTNTYLPTISLLVLVELTLFLDESRLDIAVTLSLTVLLVIYTFYQSISASIPKTAYLKLIDIWLIYILIMPFTIFVVETIMFLETAKQKNLEPGCGKIPKQGWVEKKSETQSKFQKFHKLVKIGIPMVSLVLTFIYFIHAVYIYKNP